MLVNKLKTYTKTHMNYRSHLVFNKNDMTRLRLEHFCRYVTLRAGNSTKRESRGERDLVCDDPGVDHCDYSQLMPTLKKLLTYLYLT